MTQGNLLTSTLGPDPKLLDMLILFGGGIDSCVLCTQAWTQHRNPLLFYIDYGAKAAPGEIEAMGNMAARFKFRQDVLHLPTEIIAPSPLTEGTMQTEQAKNEVPARNMVFLSLAFMYACKLGINTIWIGSDPPRPPWQGFRDSRQPTFDAFNALTAYAYGDYSPRVYAPLLAYQDTIYYLRHALVVMPDLLDVAFTCYESNGPKECGECNHCKRKARLRSELPDRVGPPFAEAVQG